MLQRIREHFIGWVAGGIILLLGLSLAVTFGNMDAGTATGDYAARVNGEDIPLLDYRENYQDQLAAQQQLYQGELPAIIEDEIKRAVLERMVLGRALAQFVRDAGYRVDDERVRERIRGLEAFQVGGQFSPESYRITLASRGIAPTAFEEDQRTSLVLQQLEQGIVESAFFTPAEFRRYITLEGQQRRVTYVLLDPRQLALASSISEDDIQAYYAANGAQFQTEERVSLEYVELSLSDIAAGVTVDEDDVRRAYEEQPERFRTAEERLVRHILVAIPPDGDDQAAAARATELAGRLAAGESFESLAREYSDDPGSAADGGSLGWSGQGVFVAPFEDAAFGLAKGEVSSPVRTEFGYHLIRVDDIRAGGEQPFEEVRDQLAEEVRLRKAEDQFYALAERVDDLALENPTTLGPVVEQTGLPLKRVGRFTRTDGGALGNSPALISAVFSPLVLEDGENTPLLELGDGRVLVARVAEHELPQPRPLAEVRPAIVETLQVLRGSTAAVSQGEALLRRARAGEDLGALATELGLPLTQPGAITRSAASVPAEVLAAIFRAPRPPQGSPVVRGLALASGGYAVFRLDEVIEGRPEDVPREARDVRKRSLARQVGSLETQALAVDLRGQARVVIPPDLFEEPEDL